MKARDALFGEFEGGDDFAGNRSARGREHRNGDAQLRSVEGRIVVAPRIIDNRGIAARSNVGENLRDLGDDLRRQRSTRHPGSRPARSSRKRKRRSRASRLQRVQRALPHALRREDSLELVADADVGGDVARDALRPSLHVHHDRYFSRPLVDQTRQPVDLLARRHVDVPAARRRRRAHARALRTPSLRSPLIESSTRRLFARRRAGPLAHAQAPFDDENRVVLEELLRLRIDLREDDHVAGCRSCLRACAIEDLLSGFGERAPHAGDHARDRDGGVVFDSVRRSLIGVAPVRASASATSASGWPETKMPSVSFPMRASRASSARRTCGSVGASAGACAARIAEERDLPELGVARRARGKIQRGIERRELLRAVSGQRCRARRT